MTHNSLRAVLPSPIVRTVVVWGAQMKIVMQIAAALWLLQAASVLKAKRGFLSEYFNECVEEIEAPNRKPVYIELSSGLRSDDPKQRRPDITRAESLLGWQPTLSLKEGLRDTIDYFREKLQAR